MHGSGNDYIYINGIDNIPADLSKLSIAMSDRHKGVGADGIIIIQRSDIADVKMQIFNADGSEAEMCGNASRCVGKYIYDKRLIHKKTITLETLSGIKVLHLHLHNDEVSEITVDMGEPRLKAEEIPVKAPADVVNFPIQTSAGLFYITAVSMGNPHGVVFTSSIQKLDLARIAPTIESNSIFPNHANIEFAEIIDSQNISMRVWERGSGETMACGTGACATLVAAVILGKCKRECTIHLLGGNLTIKWDDNDNHVYMTGDANTVFEGTYIYNNG